MKLKLNEDYYFWCCDWCDSENRVLVSRMLEGATCGACHRPMDILDMSGACIYSNTKFFDSRSVCRCTWEATEHLSCLK
ncbi:MAG: hypothetical protein PHY09_01505 [Desulfuromonadaceae bacterium]|nr:hypothetical protein [Desulfuromonadaceae bacterium]MDD5104545.1 hypothetical protein [Desulfuromonadaceae bacterium]